MLKFDRHNILSHYQLKRLSDHVYTSESNSLLDPLFQPYWNYVLCLLPTWLAPNMITLIGLLINVATTLVMIIYSMDGKTEAPRWTYGLCAVGLFVYQTLDAIDGKQARRTGTSSPLGELFDHGCDSISSVFVILSVCIAIQLGEYPLFMFFFFFCGITAFYCAHWQTYVSGTLRFGKIDVTEAQIIIISVHLVSAICGTSIWNKKVFAGLFIELRILLCTVALIGCFVMIFNVFHIILSGGIGKNGSTVAGTSVLSPAIPLILVVLPAYVISQKSITNILENHPVLYVVTFGMISAKVTNKLVVAHMTKSEMQFLDSSMLGAMALFLNQYFNYVLPEYGVLWLALVWAVYNLLMYCSTICIDICQHLHIRLLTIPSTKIYQPTIYFLESKLLSFKEPPSTKNHNNNRSYSGQRHKINKKLL